MADNLPAPTPAPAQPHPRTALEIALSCLNPFILAGPNWSNKRLGDYGPHHCPFCNGLEHFHYEVRYVYFHVLFLFSFILRRKYVLVCNYCMETVPAERSEALQERTSDPIPFIRRKGWVVCLAALGLVLVYCLSSSFFTRQLAQHRIDNPIPGDLYLADFSKVRGSNHHQWNARFYGYMQLAGVEGEQFVFAPAHNIVAASPQRPRETMKKQPELFHFEATHPISLHRRALQALLDQGDLVSIQRP